MGQEQYQSLTKSYFKSAALAVVTFDLTDHKSFDDVGGWVALVRNNVSHELPLYVIGNKSDLKTEYADSNNGANDRRQVSELEARENAEGVWNAKYFEVSAKTGTSVGELFQTAAEALANAIATGKIDQELYEVQGVRKGREMPSFLKHLSSKPKKKRGCC